MSGAVAIVQPVADYEIREINALDARIVATEDDADALLWQQAEQVVAQLDAGLSQRRLAAQWINARTGEPHSVAHVNYTARIFRVQFTEQPRPRFRDAYNVLSNTSKRLSHNTGCFEWYTPADIIEAARAVLGAIDLDPASSEHANTVVKAARFFTREDDGLTQPWLGRVWMNPPYAQPLVTQFCEKLAASLTAGDVTAAIVITNNATETAFFKTLASVARAVCFPPGRVHFWQPNTTPDTGPLQGQAVVYAGPNVGRFTEHFSPLGLIWVRP
jgi:ParB family chromosome partitioning protein